MNVAAFGETRISEILVLPIDKEAVAIPVAFAGNWEAAEDIFRPYIYDQPRPCIATSAPTDCNSIDVEWAHAAAPHRESQIRIVCGSKREGHVLQGFLADHRSAMPKPVFAFVVL